MTGSIYGSLVHSHLQRLTEILRYYHAPVFVYLSMWEVTKPALRRMSWEDSGLEYNESPMPSMEGCYTNAPYTYARYSFE